MNGGRPVRVLLALLIGWTILREAEVGPLRGLMHGPLFGKLAYWIVIVGASLLTLWRANSMRGREGLAWGLIGAGSLLWACGDVYWTLVLADHAVIPVPSISDAGYLAFYPLVFAGLCLLLRSRVEGAPKTLWVDGLTAALAAAAMSAAVVLQAVLHTVGGNALGVATNLAYPVGDLILLAVVVAAFALRGWRADRTWALLGLGIVLFWIADSYYLVTVANETYVYPSLWDGGWTSCLVLFSAAAWQPARRTVAIEDSGSMRFTAFPIAFASLGLGILVLAALGSLNSLAVVLAAASLLAVFARLVLSLRENAGMLTTSRHEALTDALTGLGNRRALTRDLDRVAEGDRKPAVLALFDLDGFKHYNDSYGHPAGDALLQRLGAKLAVHVRGAGTAYRMGGDEFCVLLPDNGSAEQVADCAAALTEHGDGFTITCSFGSICVPGEVHDAGEALRVADQRMYAHKHSGRSSARSQSRDVLLRALAERNPELGEHISGVAELAEAVACRMELDEEQIDHVRHAAALHDVGKMAIPDAILDKPAALDERIVAAAPALRPVAALVRSSHERWDGCGYPDALAGEDIPLGARIVSVCDAFDAMVADRPYRAGMDADDALVELERCSGSQFDPAVVTAFADAWSSRTALRAAARPLHPAAAPAPPDPRRGRCTPTRPLRRRRAHSGRDAACLPRARSLAQGHRPRPSLAARGLARRARVGARAHRLPAPPADGAGRPARLLRRRLALRVRRGRGRQRADRRGGPHQQPGALAVVGGGRRAARRAPSGQRAAGRGDRRRRALDEPAVAHPSQRGALRARGRGDRRSGGLERPGPGLLDEVVPEAVVGGRLDQLEAGALVEPARRVQDVVGPQRDARVAGALGEAQALLDQARADAAAPRARVDEQQAQLRDVLLAAHAQHAAGGLAVDLGDPRGLAARVVVARVLGHDLRDERLEALVPAVLLRIEPAVSLDDPAEVAGTRRAQDDCARRGRTVEHLPHDVHGADEAPLLVVGEDVEDGADLVGRPAVELGEGGRPLLGEADPLAAGVVGRALAGDQAVALQSREQAAEKAGVDVHLAAQVGDLGDLALAELVEHARLGQRVGRAQQAVAQDADARGVEAVEGADGGDAVFDDDGTGGHA
jgi:two-component system cell cycle response regulator